jgi:hypothetical protein
LTLYGDPQGAKSSFEVFQYFSLKNLQWNGTLPASGGSGGGTIKLNLASGEFKKTSENHWNLTAKTLDLGIATNDGGALIQARNVEAQFEFWSLNGLPALNYSVVLSGNVNVTISASVFTLPGAMQVSYASNSERFVIYVCIIKPIQVDIVSPLEGQMEFLKGSVLVQADVKTAPGISVTQGSWWVDDKANKGAHFEGQMNYNEATGKWEGLWQTYQFGNGWYWLGVKMEGTQQGGFGFWAQDMVSVEVNNPWVEGRVIHQDGSQEDVWGIQINLAKPDGSTWSRQTTFSIAPDWIGVSLTAPGNLGNNPKMQFQKWTIPSDQQPEIWQSQNQTITITQDMQNMLFNDGAGARPLRIFYVETP